MFLLGVLSVCTKMIVCVHLLCVLKRPNSPVSGSFPAIFFQKETRWPGCLVCYNYPRCDRYLSICPSAVLFRPVSLPLSLYLSLRSPVRPVSLPALPVLYTYRARAVRDRLCCPHVPLTCPSPSLGAFDNNAYTVEDEEAPAEGKALVDFAMYL